MLFNIYEIINMQNKGVQKMDSNIEMLQRAKMYLDKLEKGVDPFTDADLPSDTILSNHRLRRCFSFVCEVLQKVIDNGGEVKRVIKQNLPPFEITQEQKEKVELSDEPIQISKFCERINNQIDTEKLSKLKVTAFGKWLLEKGFLTTEKRNNKDYRRVTEAGMSLGITSEWRQYGDRGFYAVSYDRNAQQFLLDNLDAVIAISNGGVEA